MKRKAWKIREEACFRLFALSPVQFVTGLTAVGGNSAITVALLSNIRKFNWGTFWRTSTFIYVVSDQRPENNNDDECIERHWQHDYMCSSEGHKCLVCLKMSLFLLKSHEHSNDLICVSQRNNKILTMSDSKVFFVCLRCSWFSRLPPSFCENMCNLSYNHHQIGRMTHYLGLAHQIMVWTQCISIFLL